MGCAAQIRYTTLGLVVAAMTTTAGAQVINFQVEFDGEINGETIDASGGGGLDRNGTGNNFADIGFEALPRNFSPFAVDALLTNICPNGFRADGDSQNLWDLGGGNYSIERTFQWIGFPGSTIFSSADVTYDDDSETLFSSMTFSGNYNGPTDLVAIESYGVLWLPGSTDGEFFESGTAVVRRANGEQLLVQFATRYFGLQENLLETQFGIGSLDASFDGQNLTVGWEGEFEVTPTPGTGLVCGMGLLAMSRRRR
jgi:hypothetical protein